MKLVPFAFIVFRRPGGHRLLLSGLGHPIRQFRTLDDIGHWLKRHVCGWPDQYQTTHNDAYVLVYSRQ